jgi:hypothetical protein
MSALENIIGVQEPVKVSYTWKMLGFLHKGIQILAVV